MNVSTDFCVGDQKNVATTRITAEEKRRYRGREGLEHLLVTCFGGKQEGGATLKAEGTVRRLFGNERGNNRNLAALPNDGGEGSPTTVCMIIVINLKAGATQIKGRAKQPGVRNTNDA